ncbi:Beta-carotene hydroxylase 1, chloroplastic [Zea mays]|uniref:beta-carotene 3-hydroxylase n=1 Tax=Zea mays TaxID=4577 RepID=A0A3L6DJ84_MAIZE|nr:Beta-carotene hydroxylase 1, chloroplastic [Zea mays]
MSSLGVTSMAIAAVYYRFSWQMEWLKRNAGNFTPLHALQWRGPDRDGVLGAWAHQALWHASLWHMHESHHRPREGPFELNDVFAIVNAVPAISLLGDVASRYTTWTSLRASRMGSSWDQRSCMRSVAWTS